MDPIVYRYKTLLMQRLVDWTTRGYFSWTSGIVSADRANALAEKFDAQYFVARRRGERLYARKTERANATFVLADLDKSGQLHWWLLVTAGTHPAYQLERLADSRERDGRIDLTGYEMLQLQNDRRNGGKIRWTWRMTDETEAMWEASIRAVIRGRHPHEEVQQLIASLARMPGFHGIRGQADKMRRLLASEWQRAGLGKLDLPDRLLTYTRRLANENYLLSHWLQERYPDLVQQPSTGQLPLLVDEPKRNPDDAEIT